MEEWWWRRQAPPREYRGEPCARCPWLRESPVGVFPAEVFRYSARTAYDLATSVFGCHASPKDEPQTCAGFLLRGADHNLSVRMHGPDKADIHCDRDLYTDYREMAVANGVDPNDSTLAQCRNNTQ